MSLDGVVAELRRIGGKASRVNGAEPSEPVLNPSMKLFGQKTMSIFLRYNIMDEY